MKNIEYIRDNEENRTEEYLDSEIIVDNEDKYDFARIAHEINEIVEGSFIEVPENLDIGSTDFRDRCRNTLDEDYDYLDEEDKSKIMKIIMENY